jgi:ketosteroid isomerase-like protein
VDVDELRAVQSITEICHSYALAVDGHDWQALRRCFTADATADYLDRPSCDGYEAIESFIRRALEPLDASQHLIGNVTVKIGAESATSTCYLHAQHVRRGTPGGDLFTIGGTYRDTLVRGSTGWRISHRSLEATWSAGNPAVLGRTAHLG